MVKIGSYWSNMLEAFLSLRKGLGLTFSHLTRIGKQRSNQSRLNIQDALYFQSQRGIATIQFPHEQLPVPVTGRYQLHNEMDDCIVCDKCVKVCPVNCITIEPIRSPEEFGKTSDGSPKRIYAARFDIDMGKCCFCGLCTTVCPTECLTMTPEFDFSTFTMDKHYFKFGNLSEAAIVEKKAAWSRHQETKLTATPVAPTTTKPSALKPVMKPKINPKPGAGNEQ